MDPLRQLFSTKREVMDRAGCAAALVIVGLLALLIALVICVP
jgi:hypothetical protein